MQLHPLLIILFLVSVHCPSIMRYQGENIPEGFGKYYLCRIPANILTLFRPVSNWMGKDKNVTESELLSLLVKGDMNAFDEIYWKYQRAVYQNSVRLTRDTTSAEDITQEVFVSLWEKRQSINPEIPVAGWLFVSSYNRSVNVLRKKLRELRVVDRLSHEEISPETISELSELKMTILNDAITLLSLQKRKVFELCKLQGKSYEEAAMEMQISKHTVKEYLSEAMAFIKDFAREHPILDIAVISWMLF